ncbi:glycoside hydrolase family 95 protein (plasmid) [Croceibacterium sp. TMG7-5b_MA50]|uniref:glycoside hydrolase family 95 protein n=1 Tax=Croceibacterium sp. TMG7-5b_MA50 TaxID=3121290 RepID=UPI0032221683
MRIDRRDLLKAGGPALAALGLRPVRAQDAATPAAEPAEQSTMWYAEPARVWEEALAIGNGRLGAMVFGGVKRERLQLNEDTLWSGGPYNALNPRARGSLEEVRALIFAGRYEEAEALAARDLQSEPMRQMSYQSLGDLWLDIADINETDVTEYRRTLDLDSAVATTRFVAGGRRFVREVFSSHPDQVLVVRITGDAPFDLSVGLGSGLPGDARTDGDGLLLSGHNNADRGVPGVIRFAARAVLLADGGTTSATDDELHASGAGAVTLLLAAATNVRSPTDLTGDPVAITAQTGAAARAVPFARLRQRHVEAHQALFRRVSIALGSDGSSRRPTDQRIRRGGGVEDPALAALYFQFGRYLMIASSRPGTQAANLQGIWNDRNQPPWGSKYTLNINAEMNYWPVDSANLSECIEPFVRMVEELAASGRKTARDLYGARGWVAHHNTDLWRTSTPVDHARTGIWPCGAAWLACQLWDHWDWHRDDEYLARIYPVLRDAALFHLDTLQRDPRSGFLVTNPSNSPENAHPHGSTLCAGPAMDTQLLRDLFDRAGDAARRLRQDAGLRRDWARTRDQLAPDRIGKAGQLQEWQEDWDMEAPDLHHRHVSHLYALYPGQQIDPDATPALAQAARRSLEIRGDDATGWGLGWRLNLWARLRDGAHAHTILASLLGPERTYPNLFDAHPPFQIDGNFGGTAGIIEMLVQTRGDTLRLLPALPAQWPTGHITGVLQRGGCAIDLEWRDGRVTQVRLTARVPLQRRVVTPHGSADVRLNAGETRVMTTFA